MAGNPRRMAELGMATGLAKEVANQISSASSGVPAPASTAPAALAATAAVGVGTTYARADHVHAIPGVSVGAVRGTVLIQAAQADSTASDVAGLVTDFNALLTKLRAAGVLTP